MIGRYVLIHLSAILFLSTAVLFQNCSSKPTMKFKSEIEALKKEKVPAT